MPDQAGNLTDEEMRMNERRWDLQTFTYLVSIVRQTRSKATPATFDSTTSAERELIWGTVWKDKPAAVSQTLAGEPGGVIDWQALFGDGAGQDMLDIRSGFKKKFVLACEAVVCSCPDIDKISAKDLEAWRCCWRSLHDDPDVAKLRNLEVALKPEDKALWERVRGRAKAKGHHA